jgi:tetratricopeptide (TPR) repeat protein
METPGKVGGVPDEPGVLASWKSIGQFFHCDERTVKRWEQERGLPVHRAPGGKRGYVFAYIWELDNWLRVGEKQENPEPSARKEASDVTPNFTPSASAISAAEGKQPAQIAKPIFVNRRFVWGTAGMVILLLAGAAEAPHILKGSHAVPPAESSVFRSTPSTLWHIPASGAENLYLQGRYFWNLRTADGLAKAIDFYTQAIVRDPQYAEAYAGLAESFDLLPQFGRAELGESLRKAEEAADRAIELNPNLADAHAAKAFALFYGDWDVAASEAEFQRALALDPNSARTHHWYASTLHDRMEKDACLQQIEQALRLDPTSAAIATDEAFFRADFGDLDSGVKALQDIERTQPTLATPPDFLRAIDFARGNFPGYIAQARRYAEITHDSGALAMADAEARGWARAGKIGLVEERAKALKSAFDQGREWNFALGEALLLLGGKQEALPYFRAALSHHDLWIMFMLRLPWAQQLAKDPGYSALFAQARQRVHMGNLPPGKDIPVELGLPWQP